jgi:chorismate mutase
MNAGRAEIVDIPFLDDYASAPDDPGHAEPETEDAAADLAVLDEQLRRLDHELLLLVRRRTELARRLTARRVDAGGTAYVHDQDLAVFRRYRALGSSGRELATLLLRQAAMPIPAAAPTGRAAVPPADPSVP